MSTQPELSSMIYKVPERLGTEDYIPEATNWVVFSKP